VIRYVTEADATGGAEVYLARLARHFGGDVLSVGPLPEATRALLHGLAVREVDRPRGRTDLRALAALARALRGTELVHVVANEPANNRYAMAAARLARVPYVVTLQAAGGTYPGLRRHYAGAAAALAVSRETAALVEGLGVPCAVVPNGVDLPPRPVPVRDRAPLRVGTLARLSYEKGLDVLLDAARDVPGIDLHVGGDGPLRAELERRGGATFHGRVDAGAFLADLDAFALPSRAEGLPFALLEAMAYGLPCVGTAVGDVPEALRDCGIVVPPADPAALAAALRDLTDAATRRALGAAARRRVEERYDARVMYAATASAYAAARARRRRRGPARPPAR
jgi:glycosyltransferase involved in cell wall biosynthesis